jgi:hypothetical protein
MEPPSIQQIRETRAATARSTTLSPVDALM